MNKQKQDGFAHLVVFIILALVIIGGLGFVYWQNFANKVGTTIQQDTTAQQDIPTDLKNAMKTFFPEMEVVSVSSPETSYGAQYYTCLLKSDNSKINKLYLSTYIAKDNPFVKDKIKEDKKIAELKTQGIKSDFTPSLSQMRIVTINGHTWSNRIGYDDPKGIDLNVAIFMDIDNAEPMFQNLAEKINQEMPETVVLYFQYIYNEELNTYDEGKGLVVSLLYVPKTEFKYEKGYSSTLDKAKKINQYKYDKSSGNWSLINTRNY